MKVAFNARLLYAPTLRGWNRYTVNLLAELPNLGVELYLYSDRPIHPDHLARLPQDSYQIRLESGLRYPVWEQYWLPQQCRRDQVDILHSPFNFGLPWFSPCPRVLTLHDAINQVYYGSQAQWQQKFQPKALQMSFHNWVAYSKAEAIITVSNHAKGDLIKYLGIPDRKITVIYEAADPNFHQPIQQSDRSLVRTKYNLNFPYIFYVGGWEQRKNILFLLKAFAQAKLDEKLEGVKLVLAGGSEVQKIEVQDLAIALNISESLELLCWVEEEDLPILYAEALCFVYPSEYEGFGLQLCEAMAVGCPVLAANSTCLPEILGDGGKVFNIDNPEELIQLLIKVNSANKFRIDLAGSALNKSQEYSWKKTAMATYSLYKQF